MAMVALRHTSRDSVLGSLGSIKEQVTMVALHRASRDNGPSVTSRRSVGRDNGYSLPYKERRCRRIGQ